MKKLAWFAVLGAGLALVVTEAAREGAAAQGQDVKLVALSEKGARLEFTPPAGAAGELQVELCNLEGKVLARAAQAMGRAPHGVALDAELDPKAPASYYLRYRFGAESEWIQKSFFFLTRVLETIVLGQRDYLAGTRPELRILVRDRAAGQPVADAAVTLSLADDQGKELFRREARTNPQGEAPIAMELPDREAALRLKIEVDAGTAADVVEETIQVKSGAR